VIVVEVVEKRVHRMYLISVAELSWKRRKQEEGAV